ncbi:MULTISPECIES: hypothetical protein [Photorhabdus]|uniref:Uncharacterized protein n=1 Tax=Photorhabdus bodei TaxID=2029681 RepID=A0AAW6BE34_9GAMM|nr:MULTISPECIES: hypothetical protein [Photorhabdus]MDB6366227.1 hypothetical protein [Photorhabdus bodei]MDB6370848.1 hypothetical protein [Photorhabdus bodei]
MTGVSECSQQRGSLKDDGYSGNQGKEILYSSLGIFLLVIL